MVEPLSLLAGAITTYIIPKALEKAGEKIGEAALAIAVGARPSLQRYQSASFGRVVLRPGAVCRGQTPLYPSPGNHAELLGEHHRKRR